MHAPTKSTTPHPPHPFITRPYVPHTQEGEAAAAELGKLSGEALLQRYALRCPDKLPLVKAMLKAQGLA